MSEHVVSEVKVGALVAASMLLLLITVFSISRCNPFRLEPLRYQARFHYAGGLTEGAVVRFGGLSVGRVESVKISSTENLGNTVLIGVALAPDTPVKKDSEATITSLGMLGENYLEISLGSSKTERLPAGSHLQVKEYPSIQEVFAKVDTALVDAQKLIKDVHAQINQIAGKADVLLTDMDKTFSENNQKKLTSILAQTDQMIRQTSPQIDETLTQVRSATKRVDPMFAQVETVIKKVDTLVSNLDGTVAELKPELTSSLDQLDKTLEEARLALSEMRSLLSANRGQLETVLENLSATSDNLRELTNDLKQRPSSLLRSPSPKPRLLPEINQR